MLEKKIMKSIFGWETVNKFNKIYNNFRLIVNLEFELCLRNRSIKQNVTLHMYFREVQITYITAGISVDTLREEMRTICGFGAGPGSGQDQFTMKWVDDEGDPCRIVSQQELDEALRLYELEKDTEITIHGKYPAFVTLIFLTN